MSSLGKSLRRWLQPDAGDSGDALAWLLLAAKDDPAFRDQLRLILRLPAKQREPIINTAIAEMRLRGEPASACAAFATLSSDEGAKTALKVLEAQS